MVNIDQVSIRGFKSHDDLEFPAKSINIITGKNNVGKTSVLESIDLLFNPKNIREYNGNVEKLINFNSEFSSITCDISGVRGQRSLDNYSQESLKRKLNIIKMSEEDQYSTLLNALDSRITNSFEFTETDQVSEEVRERYFTAQTFAIQKTISDVRSNDDIGKYIESAVILEQDDVSTPYIYLSDDYTDLIGEVVDVTMAKLKEDIDFDMEDISKDVIVNIDRQMRTLIIGRHGRANFLGQPDHIEGTKFVRTLDITKKDIDKVDNHSVILSRIEDDLRKHNTIKDLYDFSLDNLVFETGTERYQLPYEFMGDGFKSIVGLLWELKTTDSDSQILLLEEPENHMHPGYIQTLVDFISTVSMNQNVQFFITTHNIDLIDEFIDPSNLDIEDYLKNNLQFIQMQRYASQIMDYEEAQDQFKQLHLDLRGE